jgi:hypothetical protein
MDFTRITVVYEQSALIAFTSRDEFGATMSALIELGI